MTDTLQLGLYVHHEIFSQYLIRGKTLPIGQTGRSGETLYYPTAQLWLYLYLRRYFSMYKSQIFYRAE